MLPPEAAMLMQKGKMGLQGISKGPATPGWPVLSAIWPYFTAPTRSRRSGGSVCRKRRRTEIPGFHEKWRHTSVVFLIPEEFFQPFPVLVMAGFDEKDQKNPVPSRPFINRLLTGPQDEDFLISPFTMICFSRRSAANPPAPVNPPGAGSIIFRDGSVRDFLVMPPKCYDIVKNIF